MGQKCCGIAPKSAQTLRVNSPWFLQSADFDKKEKVVVERGGAWWKEEPTEGVACLFVRMFFVRQARDSSETRTRTRIRKSFAPGCL